jgi:toxin ParE1/3/4
MRDWRIEWNDAAIDDLNYIRAYVSERNPPAAERVANRIISGTRLLRITPYMGRSGRVAGTREFVFADIPYIAIYCVREAEMVTEILTVIHTSRLWPRDD